MVYVLTNEQDESLRGRRFIRNLVFAHATNDGTDEVYVEDGIAVYQMEKDGCKEEAISTESRHDEGVEAPKSKV